MDNSVLVPQKNLQLLMIEIYINQEQIKSIFYGRYLCQKTNTYNLRNNDGLLVPRANSTAQGSETIWYIGNRLWQILPSEIKKPRNLEIFKRRIKIWPQTNATAGFVKHLLQTYVSFRLMYIYIWTVFWNFYWCISIGWNCHIYQHALLSCLSCYNDARCISIERFYYCYFHNIVAKYVRRWFD